MTTTNALSRQPTKQDYASPLQFKFQITKLPKVEFFCTTANIPGINIDVVTQPTALKNIERPGDKLSYEDLTISFIVDENLENYREIHGWLTGLGYPEDRSQARNLAGAGADRFPTSTGANQSTDAGKVKYGASSFGANLSDATLVVLSSKNNAVIEVRFSDVFPKSLSGLQYDLQATDVTYLTASVTFGYNIYNFAEKGASRTTTTVS